MQIIEEKEVYDGLFLCHFKTEIHSNQYNLTFTKVEENNTFTLHLIPIFYNRIDNKLLFDKDLRIFVCNTIYNFAKKNKCYVHFSLNITTIQDESLLYKFIRWINCFNKNFNVKSKVTISDDNNIRFFEFYLNTNV